MKNQWLIILLVMLFSACSSTMLIKKDEASLKKLNAELEGENVTIELLSGDAITAENVLVKPDSTKIGEKKIITTNIKKITITNHGTGALKGMAYGGLLTFIPSGIIYLFIMDESYSEMIFIYPAAIFVIGGILGGIHGDIEEFVFQHDQEFSQTVKVVRVEISSIVEETEKYIIVLYQNKNIHLLKSEYKNIMKTDDGKISIVIPKEVYLRKFD